MYFAAGPDCVVGSASNALGPGVDVRGPGRRCGGYLVGPGSVVGGRRYVVLEDRPLAPLPALLYELLERRGPAGVTPRRLRPATAQDRGALPPG
ncbi:bifunctional DNA primase/polymerase [Streptomyces noursei]|uniref:bifunctional DNA primase/polymerase n=1 Tax=Streptomyces noursei TaxID=1971 RepID=UPI00344DABD4